MTVDPNLAVSIPYLDNAGTLRIGLKSVVDPGATGNYRGVYDSTATYSRGDVVAEFGSGLGHSLVFVALVASSGVDPLDDVDGAPALRSWHLAFYPTDAWSSGITYSKGNVVLTATAIYVSLANGNVGHNPASDSVRWQPMDLGSLISAVAAFDNCRLYHTGEMALGSDGALYVVSFEAIPGTDPTVNPSNWTQLAPSP